MENGKIKVWLPAIRTGGGADVFTHRLASALEQHGMSAHITWFPLHGELLPFLLRQAVPPRGTDIIFANSWLGYVFKRAGLPLVVTVHHCSFAPELRPYKSIAQRIYHRYFAEPREMRSLRSANAIIAVSHFVADGLSQKLGVGKVEVIHNWVDTARFQPAKDHVRDNEPFRLLFVGNPSRLKGWDMLAPIMRKLGSGFELLVTVEAESCKKMDCPDNVRPIGRLSEDELIRAYGHCDAVLVPSRSEGFGYVALEAMACGKPVIAGTNTAQSEIVRDGITALLCDFDDLDTFVASCRLLRDNAELCTVMGRKGRDRANSLFSENVLSANYVALIRRLLALE